MRFSFTRSKILNIDIMFFFLPQMFGGHWLICNPSQAFLWCSSTLNWTLHSIWFSFLNSCISIHMHHLLLSYFSTSFISKSSCSIFQTVCIDIPATYFFFNFYVFQLYKATCISVYLLLIFVYWLHVVSIYILSFAAIILCSVSWFLDSSSHLTFFRTKKYIFRF